MPPRFGLEGKSARGRGFTQVELIVVIVVAGILAAVVLPRWQGETGFESRQFRDETVAALRYAQKTAVATRRRVCVSFTASQATFVRASAPDAADCSTGTPLNRPGLATPLTVAAPNGVSYTAPAAPFTLSFDAAGRPSAGLAISVKDLPASQNIVVEAETGYVR